MAATGIKYRSILYVDDDSDDSQLIGDAFRELDAEINVTFADGYWSIEEAIKKSGNHPDLVIVAMNRPSESEIFQLEMCKAHMSLAGLPFCILSSTTVRSVVDRAYELGAKSFLVKPSNFKILKSILDSVVSHNWSGDSQLKRDDFVVNDRVQSSRTCFMIDDDSEDRNILLNVLSELYPSLPCETAYDGEDAIQQLTDRKLIPDIIFLDLNMPRMNGIECLRAMRSMPVLNQSKIIVFTVSTDPKDMEITKALGANHFVTKPPDHDSLVGALSLVM